MKDIYETMISDLGSVLDKKWPFISNLSNAAGVLYHGMEQICWAGFYLREDNLLWLGPFQGRPACVRIEAGKGVCGTALAEKRTVLVGDVHEFPGHIACNSASRSEIVVPLFKDGDVACVLDIDSPVTGRFGESDREGLEAAARMIEKML